MAGCACWSMSARRGLPWPGCRTSVSLCGLASRVAATPTATPREWSNGQASPSIGRVGGLAARCAVSRPPLGPILRFDSDSGDEDRRHLTTWPAPGACQTAPSDGSLYPEAHPGSTQSEGVQSPDAKAAGGLDRQSSGTEIEQLPTHDSVVDVHSLYGSAGMASALLDRHHGLLLDDMAGVGDWTPFFRQSSLSAPWIFDGKGYDELAGCKDRPDRDRSVCGPAIHPVLESRGPLRRMRMEPWRSDKNRWVSELDRFKWGQVPRLSSNR